MPKRRLDDGTIEEIPPGDLAALDALYADVVQTGEARNAARTAAFAELPAEVNTIPALRAAVNEMRAFLRDMFPVLPP